jgi:hypothetical protein
MQTKPQEYYYQKQHAANYNNMQRPLAAWIPNFLSTNSSICRFENLHISKDVSSDNF